MTSVWRRVSTPIAKTDVHNGVRIHAFDVSGNLVTGIRGEIDRYRKFLTDFDGDAILIKAAQQWSFDALWPVVDQIKARKVFVPCGFSSFYEPAFKDYFRQLPDILRKFDHLIFYAESYRDVDFARANGITNFSIIPNGASEVEFGRETRQDGRLRDELGIPRDRPGFPDCWCADQRQGPRDRGRSFCAGRSRRTRRNLDPQR